MGARQFRYLSRFLPINHEIIKSTAKHRASQSDASLIVNSILHPNISSIFYDLLTNKGKVLNKIVLNETILINNQKNSFKEVRELGLEMDCTFIGYISSDKKTVLMPKNSEILENDSRLIYIE